MTEPKETEIQKRLRDLAKKYPDRAAKLWNALIQDENNMKQLEEKTNAEIGTLLLEHVWADLELWTFKSAIVETAIERLRKLADD